MWRIKRVEDLHPFPLILFSPTACLGLSSLETRESESYILGPIAQRFKIKGFPFLVCLPYTPAVSAYGLYSRLSAALIHWSLASVSTGWWVNPLPLLFSVLSGHPGVWDRPRSAVVSLWLLSGLCVQSWCCFTGAALLYLRQTVDVILLLWEALRDSGPLGKCTLSGWIMMCPRLTNTYCCAETYSCLLSEETSWEQPRLVYPVGYVRYVFCVVGFFFFNILSTNAWYS